MELLKFEKLVKGERLEPSKLRANWSRSTGLKGSHGPFTTTQDKIKVTHTEKYLLGPVGSEIKYVSFPRAASSCGGSQWWSLTECDGTEAKAIFQGQQVHLVDLVHVRAHICAKMARRAERTAAMERMPRSDW